MAMTWQLTGRPHRIRENVCGGSFGGPDVRIEVHDNGGPWNQGMVDPTRHHGLDIVCAVPANEEFRRDHTRRSILVRGDRPE